MALADIAWGGAMLEVSFLRAVQPGTLRAAWTGPLLLAGAPPQRGATVLALPAPNGTLDLGETPRTKWAAMPVADRPAVVDDDARDRAAFYTMTAVIAGIRVDSESSKKGVRLGECTGRAGVVTCPAADAFLLDDVQRHGYSRLPVATPASLTVTPGSSL